MYAASAEFLGTFLLIAVISFVGNAYAIGGALTVAILLVGNISGGHFNPAVSLWAYLAGKITVATLMAYIAAQSAAAVSVVLLKKVI